MINSTVQKSKKTAGVKVRHKMRYSDNIFLNFFPSINDIRAIKRLKTRLRYSFLIIHSGNRREVENELFKIKYTVVFLI